MTRLDPGRSARIARLELRRTWRTLIDSTRGLLLLAGGLVLLALYSLAIGLAAFVGGTELTGTSPEAVRFVTTVVLGGLAGTISFVVLQRTVKTNGDPDAADGLLTTVPYEDVLVGLVGAELGRVLTLLALPLSALVVGVTLGSGRPLLGAAVVVTTLVVATLATVGSYTAGLAVKLLVARSAFVARHRTALGAVASLLVLTGWVVATDENSARLVLLREAAGSPLAWTGDILLLSVPALGGDPVAAGVAAAALLGALAVASVACGWLAERVWYGDPIQPDHVFDATGRTLSDRLLADRVATETRVVAQKSWLRAKRAPFTVQFAFAPFFLIAFRLESVILEGTVPPNLPLLVGLAGAAGTGAAFTLNPLGGEERVLPLTLTAKLSGRAFVSGLVLAGALPGVTATALLVVGVGIAGGMAPVTLAATLATALSAAVAAPAIAAAAGVVFPKFGGTTVGDREVVIPSALAFGSYLAVLGIVAAPGTVATLSLLGTAPVGGPRLLAGGVAATVLLAAVAGTMGFLYAATRVGAYRLD
ncbi:hypothetical protein EGH22_08600 [Halomicroarcula sp. F28]|uniref:hypothetical protein n=1 Tax=Haloarcula salinisoli TaxID=2487746 RepID=UPI001C7399F6|nr:hypothetical protein [Halomicroarcula salinisoli]MBX0286384.1 hypothetical protein [Halomicroarcula salinisoli]